MFGCEGSDGGGEGGGGWGGGVWVPWGACAELGGGGWGVDRGRALDL